MSTIIVDTLTGKSTATTITIGSTPVVSASANSMTIRGEGSNQTSIQQGLIKGWIRFDGTGTIAIDDSFNYASITDNGTGNYTATLSTAMNNILYAPVAGAGDVNYGAKIDLEADVTNTTTACRLRTAGTTSGTGDTDLVAIHIAGDLS
jgi:hypothetical protein